MSEPKYNPCPYCGDDGSELNEIDELEQQLAKANERLKESEQVRTEYSFLIADLVRRADAKDDLYRNPTYKKASDQLNKFAIEQQIKALTHVLRTYKTKKFYPTNYAIQAFNDGVAHLWTHIESCEQQLRKELEK